MALSNQCIQVTEITLHPASHPKTSFTASGVKFVSNSTEYTVKAKKEVILSAGVIQSPQLLELSGKIRIWHTL